jgi:hypothetical protein
MWIYFQNKTKMFQKRKCVSETINIGERVREMIMFCRSRC